jgi:hypothetical protein
MGAFTPKPHAPERRANRRYDLEFDIRYAVKSGKRVVSTGAGKSLNLSSSGLLFTADTMLEAGSRMIAAVRWPATPGRDVPLVLVVSGRVAWSTSEHTAMTISAHTFVAEKHYWADRGRIAAGSQVQWIRRKKPKLSTAADISRPLVLVVDSEEVFRIFRALLTRSGFTVRHATMEMARQAVGRGHPEVSLLITNSLDGFQPISGQIPILLLTDQPGKYDASDPNVPVHAELAKPFFFREALSLIEKMAKWPAVQDALAVKTVRAELSN